MPAHPLDSSLAKIERAKTHIKDVEAAINTFLEARPYRLVSDLNDRGTEQVWSFAVTPIPHEIECIVADAIHNLRTPLDRMLSANFRSVVLHTAEATPNRLKFPIGNHANDMKSILADLEKHTAAPVVQFLATSEPYKGGNGHAFWALNTLDNRDKHRSLLEPIKLSFSNSEITNLVVRDAILLRMGSQRGQHFVRAPDATPTLGGNKMHQPIEGLRPIYRAASNGRGPYVQFSSLYDDMEILTTTPGAKVEGDFQPVLNIGLRDIEGFEGEDVIKALETMRDAVEIILEKFQTRFF